MSIMYADATTYYGHRDSKPGLAELAILRQGLRHLSNTSWHGVSYFSIHKTELVGGARDKQSARMGLHLLPPMPRWRVV